MNRRKERELALQMLYALEFNPTSVQESIEHLDGKRRKYATDFARRLIETTWNNRQQLDEDIKEFLVNWEINRVALIDRLLLRIALTEFMHFEDIPPEVTINEMVELSKLYGTDNSKRFINGLLDNVIKKRRKDIRARKSGRGLVSKIL
ncbi:MAG TPA: transcription antitermination factor NusB [Caldithrix abyssi]|uniref:Transcription antitermination protein NusB n=1 Tax=Caldithrix abyssi TaxID=187145 RepID=A0A7V4U0Y2_CALAY|nr:transcription antitermination factor NusB [Caldithrix abyssi]